VPGIRASYRGSLPSSISIPTTTARRVRSSSQSIRSSAKVRVFECPQNSPIRWGAVEIGEARDVDELDAGRWRAPFSAGFGLGDHVCDEFLRVRYVDTVAEAHRDTGHITP
jgi:hypothetical protein